MSLRPGRGAVIGLILVLAGCSASLPFVASPTTEGPRQLTVIAVDRASGDIKISRVVAAVDSGEAVNPDGIRNQIEGGIVQSLSWTIHEAVTFDATHRSSFDWSAYPIVRFDAVPATVEVHVIDRPGQPFLGTGEAAQGPAAAALANAVTDAVALRVRDMPLSPEKVKAVLRS